jgi:hypothetical protein
MHDLDEQIRALVDAGAKPVSAGEVLAGWSSNGPTRRRNALRRRPVAVTIAMVAAVLILAVVLIVGFRSTPSQKPAGVGSVNLPSVDLTATPKGWAPVEYGDAQVSVPASWVYAWSGCPNAVPSSGGEVFLQGTAPTRAPCSVPDNSISISSDTSDDHFGSRSQVINGIRAYMSDARISLEQVMQVPSLGVRIPIVTMDSSLTGQIVGTLTHSPRAVALAAGPHPSIPASWKRVNYDGLSVAVPKNWPVDFPGEWGSPSAVPSNLTMSDVSASPTFPRVTTDTSPSVRLTNAIYNPFAECGCYEPAKGPATWATVPIDGLLVDGGDIGPLQGTSVSANCLHLNGLSACPATDDVYGVLVLSVEYPGSGEIAVEIGLAGDGAVARTILGSIRPSNRPPTAPPPPPTTRPPTTWPERTLTSVGSAQDIAPTPAALYWLQLTSNSAMTQTVVTPVRYDRATGRITKGPSLTGNVGSPDLTVTDGFVWTVVAVGNEVVAEQLDTQTLALVDKVTLPVQNNEFGPGIVPVLTATVNGPLWVAGAQDLWALDPSTGAVERELETDVGIESMSTSPSGTLLYVGGQLVSQYPVVVVEYDAESGQQLVEEQVQGAINAVVSATVTGVWVSAVTGHEGFAEELSASALKRIAGMTTNGEPGIFDQMGGVRATVSGGVVWLSSSPNAPENLVSCADPTTGKAHATEESPNTLSALIASNGVLYGFKNPNQSATSLNSALVEITAPTSCFG